MSWQPFHLKQCMTRTLPHHETEHQLSVNNIWSSILGNQGFTGINELITELLTAFIVKNTTHNMKNTDSKIINVADFKTCKKRLLAVKYLILIIYNNPPAKTTTSYKSTDGPAGRPADNWSNSDRLGDFHLMVPELTVRWIDNPYRRLVNGSVLTWTRARSDGLALLETLFHIPQSYCGWFAVCYIEYLLILCINVINNSIMESSICAMPWLPNDQDQPLSTICWCSFWCWGNVDIKRYLPEMATITIYLNHCHKGTVRLCKMQN